MRKLKLAKFSPILIAAASTVLGILIPSLLDWLVSPVLEDAGKIILAFLAGSVFVVVAGMVYVSLRTHEVAEGQKQILQRVGVTARIHTYGEGRPNKNTFEYPTPLVKTAQEILVIDYIAGSEVAEVSKDDSSDYRAWYDTLNAAARRSGIRYKRILQLSNGATDALGPDQINDPIVLGHFRAMVEAAQSSRSRVVLKTSPVLLPNMCIIVIDQRYVIWEIPSIERGEVFRFDMDLVIEDPYGDLVRDLLTLFEQLDNNAQPVHKVSAA